MDLDRCKINCIFEKNLDPTITMKKVFLFATLMLAFLLGGYSMQAKTNSSKKTTTSSSASSFSNDFSTIKKTVTTFYEGAVIGESKPIPWKKSALSKYLTASCLNKLAREYREEWGESGYALYNFRGDPQDSDSRDKVISVEKSTDNSVIVTYTDCGFTCKTRLYMKKEGGTWKINNYKFISQSSKNKFSNW